jgi:hypothetical protein
MIIAMLINGTIVITVIIFAIIGPPATSSILLNLLIILCTVMAATVEASIFEWTLHKHIMHKKRQVKWAWLQKIVNYAHHSHELVHHGLFRADGTYHDTNGENIHKVPMAWWNGPVLVCVASLPFWGISYLLSIWFHWIWIIPSSAVATIAFIFFVYEYTHWCMHLPKNRWIERTAYFKWANGHHLLHHHGMKTSNFNVVCPPIADQLFGTYVARAKRKFTQVTGPAVPNVQPSLFQQNPKVLNLGRILLR